MPGGGRYRFYFSGRPPLIFGIVLALLCINTVAGLVLEPILRYLKPGGFSSFAPCKGLASNGIQYHVPAFICWFDLSGFFWIQFILLAIGAVVMILYRKRVSRIS
jgi:hypothetical protein